MRRLVFCFDGSWNKLDTKTHPTNVVLVAESVLPITPDGTQQIVYYDEGVGTEDDEEVLGGAFGKGLVQNIREAYRFLLFNYQPGDEIFAFGFSRGAFTARSFIGFIRSVGIVTVNDACQINEAWALYSAHAGRADAEPEPEPLLDFRARYCPALCISESEREWRKARGIDATGPILRIRYCGVWDTVGSLGWKAVEATFERSKDKVYENHDVDLGDTVEAGRHALAIDEQRVHFMPTTWRNVDALNASRGVASDHPKAPFQQKWFAGDHGSVGGGGPERGLSNAALHWVLRGAVAQGLKVNLSGRSQITDIRYDARSPLRNTPDDGIAAKELGIGLLGGAMRLLKEHLLSGDRAGPQSVADIHPSALRRWFTPADQLPEGRAYRPAPLMPLAAAIDAQHDVFVPLEVKSADVQLYVIQPGDYLSKIARDRLGDVGLTGTLFAMNRHVLDDPDDVFPGDVLMLPPVSPGSAAATAPPS